MSELFEVKTVEEASKAIQEISLKCTKMQDSAHVVKEALNRDYKQLDDLVSDISKQKKEVARLVRSLQKLEKKSTQKEEIENLRKQMVPVRRTLKVLDTQNSPETGSLFVRLFLGQVNVKQYRDGERFRLKQEYEKFKGKTNPQFMLFVFLIWLFPNSELLVTAWQIWLLYYYTTLALRENILRVNGSSIKGWWIMHHYLSITGSFTMLLWPANSTTFRNIRTVFTYFCGAQGLVQILINRYQQGQLYKLVAMGKASMMDVAGEAVGWINDPGWAPSAIFLLPFLLLVQCFQLYMSFALFQVALPTKNPWTEWQCYCVATIFMALGSGNLITTITTYYHKFKSSKKGD